LPDLTTHLERIRQQMPATTKNIFLNAGSFGPLPSCVLQAMQEQIQEEWQNGRLGAAAFEAMGKIYGDARSSVAHLLNADLNEIALTDNTGEGLNIITNGIQWHEDDEVITTNHEHMSYLRHYTSYEIAMVLSFASLILAQQQNVLFSKPLQTW